MKRNIFDIKKLFCVLALVLPMMAYADYDDDECQYFSPAYALCSVHSYNVGYTNDAGTAPANPTDADQIADMNEIIAMKATVIAQQMKQQYDFLNATIKRFKTQLEKAVLTSKMEILTGTSATGSSSTSSSSSSGTILDGTEDCNMASKANLYDCLANNLNKVSQAIDRDPSRARQQLTKDIEIAKNRASIKVDEITECKEITATQKKAKQCADYLKARVLDAKDEYELDRRSKLYGRN